MGDLFEAQVRVSCVLAAIYLFACYLHGYLR